MSEPSTERRSTQEVTPPSIQLERLIGTAALYRMVGEVQQLPEYHLVRKETGEETATFIESWVSELSQGLIMSIRRYQHEVTPGQGRTYIHSELVSGLSDLLRPYSQEGADPATAFTLSEDRPSLQIYDHRARDATA